MMPAPQPHPERALLRRYALLDATRKGPTEVVGFDEAEVLEDLAGSPNLGVSYRFEDGRRILVVRRRADA